MKSFKRKVVATGLLLALVAAVPVLAQTISSADDGTTLKQIIIFGRHSIRSSTNDPATLDQFSASPFPLFVGVPTGYLTPNGQEAARLMGSYFNAYLVHEGLLTGSAATDLNRSYFRSNSIERSFVTATKFGEGLIPDATIPVHSYAMADPDTGTPAVPDPVFDPIAAKVATADPARAQAEVQGVFGSGSALASAYSGELSLIHSALYPPGTQPTFPPGTQPPSLTPPAPQGSYDPTSVPFTLTALNPISYAGESINLDGLDLVNDANDPFVMQYADGFLPEDVAWGRLSPDALSQQTRITVLVLDIEMRSPYIDQVQSSNAASHVLRSMSQAVSGSDFRGAFGDHKSQVLVVISSDAYVDGLAGLLGLHWQLPGYQPDFIGPGGALVFELRQSKVTKEYLVRAFFTGQTFDQLRHLTPLTLEAPPATMQLTIPGGSRAAADLDVKWATFKKLLSEAIDQKDVRPFGQDDPPGVLTIVP